MSELEKYKRVAKTVFARAKKYGAPLDPADLEKLTTLCAAIYWADNYFDKNNVHDRAKVAQQILQNARIDKIPGFNANPETCEALEKLKKVLSTLPEAQATYFKNALLEALKHGEKLRTTKDIKTFIKARYVEALHTADLCSTLIADKIDQLEETRRDLFWKKSRDRVIYVNYADSFLDAPQDWKNKEILINPHILRLHLVFDKYPGKPPYLSCFTKHVKKKLKSIRQSVFGSASIPQPS